ncbi:MAG: hypothetical protein WEA80_01765 [Gemmatimonadaceae bacterium]
MSAQALEKYTEDVVNEALSQRRLHSTSLPHIAAAVNTAPSKVHLDSTLALVEELRAIVVAEGPVPQYSSRRLNRIRIDWPELWEVLRRFTPPTAEAAGIDG